MALHEITVILSDTDTGEVLYDTTIENFSPSSAGATNYLSRWLGCFVRGCSQGHSLSIELSIFYIGKDTKLCHFFENRQVIKMPDVNRAPLKSVILTIYY